MSVQDLLAVRLCEHAFCVDEAAPGSKFCRKHSEPSRVPEKTELECPGGCGQSFVGTPLRANAWVITHTKFCRKAQAVVRLEADGTPAVPPPAEQEIRSSGLTSAPDPITKEKQMPARTLDREEQEELLARSLQQVTAFRQQRGRWPIPADVDDVPEGELPSKHLRDYLEGGWQRLWEEVNAGPIPIGRAAATYRLTGVIGAPKPSKKSTEGAAGKPPAKKKPEPKAKPSPVATAAGEPLRMPLAELAAEYEAAHLAVEDAKRTLELAMARFEEAHERLYTHPLMAGPRQEA